jgi:hypothetical protein
LRQLVVVGFRAAQGTLVLVLGIDSLVLGFSCGTGVLLAPVAWVMGNSALAEIDQAPDAYTDWGSTQAAACAGSSPPCSSSSVWERSSSSSRRLATPAPDGPAAAQVNGAVGAVILAISAGLHCGRELYRTRTLDRRTRPLSASGQSRT